MSEKSIKSTKLEVHETKDVTDNHVNGELTVIWRDWDKIFDFEPKMIYISSVNKNEVKGPHLHLKRTSYFVCVKGRVMFIVKGIDGNYQEIESSEEKPVLIRIPKNIPSAHVNLSENISKVLTLADISWKPNNNEMVNVKFDDYNLKKWNK
jgi:dTDP-4-dehydrorhamnose 3,5-epimerase